MYRNSSFTKSGHNQTPIACTLNADKSTYHRLRPPRIIWWGIVEAPATWLKQWKYSQSLKDQREDVYGAPPPCPLRTTTLKARFHLGIQLRPCTSDQFRSSWRLSPNHTPRMRTVRHSSGMALEGYRYLSKYRAANLRFCQNFSVQFVISKTRLLSAVDIITHLL